MTKVTLKIIENKINYSINNIGANDYTYGKQ